MSDERIENAAIIPSRFASYALGSERPFNEITNSVKWDAANGG